MTPATETNESANVQQLTPEESAFIAELQMQIQTACRLIIRQHGLTGNWTFDGEKLVRQ